MTKPTAPVAFLDEKWFYTTNRRRRIKKLPLTEAEKNSEENKVPMYRRPKIRSRRYPVKVMYLGVVANPIEEKISTEGFIWNESRDRRQ